MTSVRMDKWLWAARFFKTRAQAAKACDLGRVHSNEIEAKPARDVRVGDMLRVKNEGGLFHVEVLQLSEIRGRRQWRRRCIGRRRPARSRGKKKRQSEKRCSNTLPCPNAGHRNATGGASFNFAAARNFDRAAAQLFPMPNQQQAGRSRRLRDGSSGIHIEAMHDQRHMCPPGDRYVNRLR
jgi:ribosome-associated heat shock protein Hsp15